MVDQYKRNPNTKCFVCSRAIYRRPTEITSNKGRVFCSQICYGQSCRIEKPCVVCKKKILSGLHKKTCSRACANIQRSGIKYKTGSRHDKVKTAKMLKNRILELMGSKCERCEYSKIEVLQVHHKDRNRSNSDLTNLELICPNCHYEEHYLEKAGK